MPDMIRDGAGSGSLAKIDSNNRIHVQSVTVPSDYNANKNGDAYNINTGIINLGTADDTPVLYVKNNEIRDFHVTAIAIGMGPSTNGSGRQPVITIIRNPTTIDFSAAVDINSNRNYGSSKTLAVTAYKGADGDAMTGGDDHILIFQTPNGRLFATIDEVLTPGASLGIKINPQTSNTSMDVYAALICHLDDEQNRD